MSFESVQKPRFLTQTQANFRQSIIRQDSVYYRLFLDLKKGKLYEGKIEIDFILDSLDFQEIEKKKLFVDFKNSKIKKLLINNSDEKEVLYDGLFLQLPQLKKGQNKVEIIYEGEYSQNGEGLHSFEDVDGSQYIYSHSEPYFCNQIFPCFDQPNLKAKLQLKVQVPSDWIVISNEVQNQLEEKGDFKTYNFPDTKILPTYLYAVLAGPYEEIKCQQKTHRDIPMSLYTRKVLMEHLKKQAEFIFEVTNENMRVYEEYFQVQYPFNKYDQIFCPEYNMGAMENAGCVTFNDDYVWKEDNVDSAKITFLASVIAHELAHHWFGNLVTMNWWNDLWLNESFAEFICYFCLSKSKIKTKKVQNVWLDFLSSKNWGYEADQLPTTHAIAGEVENTEVALNIFDGITYSKGSSVLKQLMALLGEEIFAKGIKTYFDTFAFKNATLDDFIFHLNQAFQKSNENLDLLDWKDSWICKSGLNICESLFQEGESQKGFYVKQTCYQGGNTLRDHKMKICLFEENGEITIQDFLLRSQEQTFFKYEQKKNYKAVLLNYQDHTFIKQIFDKNSLIYFTKNITNIKDQLSKALIWNSLSEMVRDSELKVSQYIDILEENLLKETDQDLIVNLLRKTPYTLLKFIPQEQLALTSKRLFNLYKKALIHFSNDSTITAAGQARLDKLVFEQEQVQFLIDWMQGNNQEYNKIEMIVDLQWKTVGLAYGLRFDQNICQQLFDKLNEKDQGEGKQQKYFIEALTSDGQKREEIWNSFIQEKLSISMRNIEFSMQGFNHKFNQKDYLPYISKWIDSIIEVNEKQNDTYAEIFLIYLIPVDNSTQTLDIIEEKFTKLREICQKRNMSTLNKNLLEQIDEIQRKRRAHKFNSQN